MNLTFPDGEIDEAAELGAVDSRSVRVWVRRPAAARAEAVLRVEGRAPVAASAPLSADADWTGAIVLALPAPAPDAPFTCAVGGRRLSGRLAPAPETHAGLSFGFGSCHMPFALGRDGRVRRHAGAGIYPAMVEDLRRADARFTLLVGDQMYSDYAPWLSVRATLGGGRRLPSFAQALAAYRAIYRGFFAERGFRALREAFPTYCIWDDHDIFNNWGSHRQETAFDRRLFVAAAHTYCAYQGTRNPGGAIRPPPYHYTFRYGDVGFLVLDVRGARDYDEGRHLGAAQWADVRAYLTGKDAATVQTLFVVSSVPVAHAGRWFVRLCERLPLRDADSVRDRWTSSAFIRSRDELLEALFAWQAAAPARQVILLSGDIHAAAALTIRRRDQPGVIRQLVSSPFTTPHGRRQDLFNLVAMQAPNLFEPRLRFRRHFLTFASNFGVVQVTPLPAGGHRVIFTVRAWRPRRRALFTAGRLVSEPRSF